MDKYAVVGNPIGHSKSPAIHAMFAEQCQQELRYDKLELSLEGFEEEVKEFFEDADNKGLNVTVPFKERAYAMCESLSQRARRAGAVNTLFMNDKNQLCGDTTDGAGLVADLRKNHNIQLNDKKILIVGAGGAVRGVLQPILEESPAELVICNRTVSKVDRLIELFAEIGEVKKSEFLALEGPFDVVINGTSASLGGELPPLPAGVIASHSVAYDMMYAKEQTIFNAWAQSKGAALTIDGLGMLVEQAAEAFNLWRGQRPQTKQVIAALR